MSKLTVILSGTAKDPDAYRALGKEARDTIQETEPDTIVYDWFLSEDGRFQNVDSYTSSEAFLQHMSNATASGFLDTCMAIVDIERVEVKGEPSADARGVLEGFGAIFLESLGGISR